MSTAMRLPPFPEPPYRARADPTVSIVVNNFNYARYLPQALDSALGQQGVDVEVVVVDDGSTDASRDVIRRYDGRVRAVLQDNRGQKAALEAGLAAAGGDVVLFLDADDTLAPGIAAAAARAFRVEPRAARAVFRLAVVDQDGRPTGATIPAAAQRLPAGDVRPQVLAWPDDLAWPPTSGNAFAAWALRRLMPLPRDGEAAGADSFLHPLVPLLGPVVALEEVGGAYRLHGANAHLRPGVDVGHSRRVLTWTGRAHAELDRVARELGHPGARPRSVTVAAHRLLSLRLGGPGHPVPADGRRRALGAGLRAAAGRADVGLPKRLAYAAWFLAAAVAPGFVVRLLGRALVQPGGPPAPARGWRLRR